MSQNKAVPSAWQCARCGKLYDGIIGMCVNCDGTLPMVPLYRHPAPVAAAWQHHIIGVLYTNHRGEQAERKIRPIVLWHGSTEWHPTLQWFLKCFDEDKQAERDFALSGFAVSVPSGEVAELIARAERHTENTVTHRDTAYIIGGPWEPTANLDSYTVMNAKMAGSPHAPRCHHGHLKSFRCTKCEAEARSVATPVAPEVATDSVTAAEQAGSSAGAGGLTFDELRRQNVARRNLLLRAKKPDFRLEDAWSLNDWMTALVGEVGEAANLLKKVHRGDYTLDSVRPDLSDELADVQTYLDLLAFAAGIDLGAATVVKWNRVSQRIDCPLRLATPVADTPVPIAEGMPSDEWCTPTLETPIP